MSPIEIEMSPGPAEASSAFVAMPPSACSGGSGDQVPRRVDEDGGARREDLYDARMSISVMAGGAD